MEPYISKKLNTRRSSSNLLGLKGKRITQRVTFKSSTARPGETLYVNIPVLPTGTALVPNTLALVATFTLSGALRHANNRAVQNLGRALVARRVVRVGDKEIESLARPDLVELYADLWRPKEERAHLVEQGIQTVEVAKHRSAAGNKNNTEADIALARAFPKYRIHFDGLGALELFRTHGALPTKDLLEIRLEVTLAPAADVIVSSDPTKVGTYLLENIFLEFQTIEPDDRAQALALAYPPPRLLFNHITHHATITFDRSARAACVVRRHPNPTRAIQCIVSTRACSQATYGKALCLSGAEWMLGVSEKRVQRPSGFFSNKYAMFIDLRAARDALVHGDGRNSQRPGRNIQYRIHRSGGTGNCALHLLILSEGAFELEDGELYK
ncbi:hypothetical protein QZH41_011309 [Actinostola sp. cb2023]|nr:hypothetical protein QZH41_011309 [Actinostola sp. cb2023]